MTDDVQEIYKILLELPDRNLDSIINSALCQVKKGRQQHYRKVIDKILQDIRHTKDFRKELQNSSIEHCLKNKSW